MCAGDVVCCIQEYHAADPENPVLKHAKKHWIQMQWPKIENKLTLDLAPQCQKARGLSKAQLEAIWSDESKRHQFVEEVTEKKWEDHAEAAAESLVYIISVVSCFTASRVTVCYPHVHKLEMWRKCYAIPVIEAIRLAEPFVPESGVVRGIWTPTENDQHTLHCDSAMEHTNMALCYRVLAATFFSEHLFLLTHCPEDLEIMSENGTDPFKKVEYRLKHHEALDPDSKV